MKVAQAHYLAFIFTLMILFLLGTMIWMLWEIVGFYTLIPILMFVLFFLLGIGGKEL